MYKIYHNHFKFEKLKFPLKIVVLSRDIENMSLKNILEISVIFEEIWKI